ncbi:hypothetical protein IVB27_09645 [Bradyrhizobium sp. 197]|uniref:hypothetical protein n=1 Tax=Bradyrhizobium sp. 197 TaxID=2782663 RepID=UPI001FFBA048|nr:hypothetical protein [Bradyrhizobium sp. 197]MCK1475056.1 hypothetical protein [Bradyrhizobium sp. 197]
MTFNLATSYSGLFFKETIPSSAGEHLVADLRTKITNAQQTKSYISTSKKLLDIAKEIDTKASLEKSRATSTSLPDVVASSADNDLNTGIFTGFFPCTTLHCRIREVDWHIAIRASVAVAEAPQQHTRISLWWSFEGVPDASGRRPEESDASSFCDLTNKMSNKVMPELKAAYEKAAQQLTSSDMVRIWLADFHSRPFAELLDTLYFSNKRSLSDITETEPVRGLTELRDYAYDVGGLNLNDSNFNLAKKIPGIKAAFCRAETHNPDGHIVSIAGFAHPAGLATALGRPRKSERYVRTMSAARTLSSRLAEQEIVEFSRRHLQSSRP